MEKSKRDGTDVFLNLLNLRNIVTDSLAHLHRDLCQDRSVITLQISKPLRQSAPLNTEQVTAQRKKMRLAKVLTYDKSSRPLQPLLEGEVVRMQTPRGHDCMGTVGKICEEPQSYVIRSGGKDYRRNASQLLLSNVWNGMELG